MVSYAEIDDHKRQIATEVVAYALDAWEQRNRAVHDIWIEEDEADTEFVRRRLRKRVAVDEEAEEETTLSMTDIEGTIRQLHTAVVRLDRLAWALRHELPSWHKGPPEHLWSHGPDEDWAMASGENKGPFGYAKLRISLAEPEDV